MSGKGSDSDDEPEQLQFKVILLGNGAVGKTSIATRFSQDSFSQNYKQTIGLDFFIKRISLPGNITVALQLWDIGGQSIGSKMISNYVYGAHAVMLCYDITNADSFADLEDWYSVVRRAKAKEQLPFTALLGNKCDLSHMRAVRMAQANTFADENGMHSFFMSAKSGDQVHGCFYRVAAQLAGVHLSKNDLSSMDGAANIVKATIVQHQRHDEEVAGGTVPEFRKRNSAKSCIIC